MKERTFASELKSHRRTVDEFIKRADTAHAEWTREVTSKKWVRGRDHVTVGLLMLVVVAIGFLILKHNEHPHKDVIARAIAKQEARVGDSAHTAQMFWEGAKGELDIQARELHALTNEIAALQKAAADQLSSRQASTQYGALPASWSRAAASPPMQRFGGERQQQPKKPPSLLRRSEHHLSGALDHPAPLPPSGW